MWKPTELRHGEGRHRTVVQMAAVLVLEPIFEADLPEEQYGYRHGRGAQTPSERFTRCSTEDTARWSIAT